MGKTISLWVARLIFNRAFYLQRYPDIRDAGLDPWEHFLSSGWQENRVVCPLAAWLRDNYDFNLLRIKGFEKIIKFAWLKIRFDRAWYLQEHPDVAVAKLDPWLHFVKCGKKEGRSWNHGSALKLRRRNGKNFFLAYPIEEYLPVQNPATKTISNRPLCVVIPFYRGIEETRICLESVIANNFSNYRILVINDQSPEDRLVKYLEELAHKKRLECITNPKNVGFVQSVNLGMRLAKNADVILLNSDTEVHGDWAGRLAEHAYSHKKIGTVTPFSNNATICSWPNLEGSEMVAQLSLVDQAFLKANRGRRVSIPTAVGFCMYVKRNCLDQIGYFDETAFGKGYGEENDFCLKASKKGWIHVHAADVFVFHKGETSFGPHSIEKQKAGETIRQRYPSYEQEVANYITKKEIDPYKFAAAAELAKSAYPERTVVFHHALGGGADKHLREYIQKNKENSFFLQIQPHLHGIRISLPALPGHPELCLAGEDLEIKILRIIEAFAITKAYVNHLFGFTKEHLAMIQRLKVPKEFMVHDYHSICPRNYLEKKNENTFCGVPAESECNTCMVPEHADKGDIRAYRARFSFLFDGVTTIVAPLNDVVKNLRKVHPMITAAVKPHVELSLGTKKLHNPFESAELFRVVLLGHLSSHKGRQHVLRALHSLDPSQRMQIHLIGQMIPKLDDILFSHLVEQRIYSETGEYRDDSEALQNLERIKPHLIWFPGAIPETFSYTLHLALEAGLPILGPDLGYFQERTLNRPFTFYFDHRATTNPVGKLCEIAHQLSMQPKSARWDRTDKPYSEKEL